MNRERGERKFKGVRKRPWGKWVSEMRIPYDRTRIWLGSYDDPIKAARAYDAALLCIYGPSTNKEFNFPEERMYWPSIPEQQRRTLSRSAIKSIAIWYVFHVAAASATATAPAPPHVAGTALAPHVVAPAGHVAPDVFAPHVVSPAPAPLPVVAHGPSAVVDPSPPLAVLQANMMPSEEHNVDDEDELTGMSSETFLLTNMNAMQEMIKSWEK